MTKIVSLAFQSSWISDAIEYFLLMFFFTEFPLNVLSCFISSSLQFYSFSAVIQLLNVNFLMLPLDSILMYFFTLVNSSQSDEF